MKVGTIYTLNEGEEGQFLCLSLVPDKGWAYMVQVCGHFPPGYEGSFFDLNEWAGVNMYIKPTMTRGEADFPIALIDTAGWTVERDNHWSPLTLENEYSTIGIQKILARLLKNKKMKPFKVGG